MVKKYSSSEYSNNSGRLSCLWMAEQIGTQPWPELSGWPGTVCSILQCRSERRPSKCHRSYRRPTAVLKSGLGWEETQRSDRPGSQRWRSRSCSPPRRRGRPRRRRRPAGWSSPARGRTSQSLRLPAPGRHMWWRGPKRSRCSRGSSRWLRSGSGDICGGTGLVADSRAASGRDPSPDFPESRNPSRGRRTEQNACQWSTWSGEEDADTVRSYSIYVCTYAFIIYLSYSNFAKVWNIHEVV